MEYRTIEEWCEILDSQRIPITAKNRIEGPYPYYGANGIQDYVNDYIFDDELVLLAEDGGNFGSKDRPIAYRVSGKCWVNNHAHVLKPKNGLDVDYLCYSLMFYNTNGLVNGATRQKLTQSTMRTMKIPCLEINEQQEIVQKIKKIESILNDLNGQLDLLDELIKARFVEMFGTIYDKKFDMKTLPDIVSSDKNSIKRGPFGGALKKEDFLEDGYMVYEQRHAIHEDFEYAKYYVSPEKYESMIGFKVVPGDLIISCSGTLGRIAEVPMGAKEGIINQALLKISLNKDIMNNQFFIYQFRSKEIQDMLFGISRGSGIANMPSMNEVKAFKFICPPLELQNQFASFVQEIDKSRSRIQKSLEASQELFDSLMQEYFD